MRISATISLCGTAAVPVGLRQVDRQFALRRILSFRQTARVSVGRLVQTTSAETKMDPVESAKKKAAFMAIDSHVQNNFRIGIGSGSTVVYAVERLAERVKEEGLKVVCVPTSFQARQLIVENNLPLTDLEITPQLDVCIDGADEADPSLCLIKGGGGCLLQEKVVASAAELFVVIADYRKKSASLGQQWTRGVPVEVVGMAYRPVQAAIERALGGRAVLRQAKAKAGPVVTDNGNLLLDWHFEGDRDWRSVNTTIKMIPGVVETGLFVDMARVAYFGMEDGSVSEVKVD